MLATAPQLTARARCARPGALGAFATPNGALGRHRQQQARGFRFARIWSSHFDSESHRDVCRRQRKLRYKYAEALNRRLSGEKHPFADDAKAALKRMVRDYWHPMTDPRLGGRYVNASMARKTPDNPTGTRPGRNIEDVEREPMSHILFGDRGEGHFQSLQDLMASATFQTARATPSRSRGTASDNLASASSTSTAKEEYIIDPITNRKRPRSPSNSSPPASSKEASSRSRFMAEDASKTNGAGEPIFYDGPPPQAELEKYDQVKIDPMPWDTVQSHDATQQEPPTTQDKQPVLESEEYVRNHGAVPSSTSAIRDDDWASDWQHQGVSWHRSDGIFPPEANGDIRTWSLNPEYFRNKELEKYKPVMHDEGMATQNNTPAYDDLHKYKPVMVNEPEATLDEPPQEYEDLHKYNAFRYQEPDGKPPVEESAPMPELEKYQPFLYNEPDGKPANHEEPTIDPVELSKYQAFRYNEPDGKPANHEEPKIDPTELSKYQAFTYNEPDGKPPVTEETNQCDPAELQKYRPFMYNEPDGKPPGYVEEGSEYDPEELQRYGAFMYNEPDGMAPTGAKEESGVSASELDNYRPVRHNEPDGKPLTKTSDGPDLAELNRYDEAVRWNEPDGKPAEEVDPTVQSLKDFELKSSDGEQPSQAGFARTFPENPEENSNYRQKLESLMARHAARSDEVDSEAMSALRESRLRTSDSPEPGAKKFTGNYVQDFPEDFTRSWSADTTSNASLLPKEASTDASQCSTAPEPAGSSAEQEIQKAEREQVEGVSFHSPAALQPALDRQQKSERPYSKRAALEEAVADPYSKEPQGLETSYAEECAGQSTWPTYVRNYGSVNENPESAVGGSENNTTGSADGATPEPILYKILAYDPDMQTIDVAETSSNVADGTSPQSPAEVILRLSNPAKFFPHFGPLQAQGFEIVSGNGDVLVFRKVRPATGQQDATTETAPAPAEDATSAPTINPIDMTGVGPRNDPSPAPSMFANPTGFVNYDLPPLEESSSSEPASRFTSGIDGRREEPVFSGAKSGRGNRAKTKLPKRIVAGAAWVAGITYALGVMGQYFKTGGEDGKGPGRL